MHKILGLCSAWGLLGITVLHSLTLPWLTVDVFWGGLGGINNRRQNRLIYKECQTVRSQENDYNFASISILSFASVDTQAQAACDWQWIDRSLGREILTFPCCCCPTPSSLHKSHGCRVNWIITPGLLQWRSWFFVIFLKNKQKLAGPIWCSHSSKSNKNCANEQSAKEKWFLYVSFRKLLFIWTE